MAEIEVGTVGMIDIDTIVVSDRARTVMGDLDGLEENMKQGPGLISPLAVKREENGSYRLLAGERRYTVLKRNGVHAIPVRIYDRDLSDLEMKVIEKSENFHRKDMEYYELDKLTLEIHQMQQELYGQKADGPGEEGWGMKETGELLGGKSKATVSNSIRRAEARDAFPELFDGCKSASDASKMLKKMDEAVIKQALAKKIESSPEHKDVKQLAKAFVINSFFEGVKDIPDEYMNLVEIDPPYAINLMSKKKSPGESKYVKSDYNEIPPEYYIDGHPEPTNPWRGLRYMFQECYRVMSANSWLLCWFAPEPWFQPVFDAICSAGFSSTRMACIWTKNSPGQSMSPTTRLANSYEMFFYAWKGKPILNRPGHGNEFRCSPIVGQQKTHPTERPIELMKEIYDTFALPGSRVLIPCLGSGNGLIAAHQLNMSPVGFELSKGYKDSYLVKIHSMLQSV